MPLAVQKIVLKDAAVVWRENCSSYLTKWRTEILAALIEPVVSFFALAFGVAKLVGNLEDGTSYAVFISAGLLSFNVLTAIFMELSYNSFDRMEYDEKYSAWLAQGINAESAAFGDLIWGVTKGLLHGVFILALIFISGIARTSSIFLAAIPLGFGGLLIGGWVLGTVARLRDPDHIKFLQAAFFSLMAIGGLWFPLKVFPYWLQMASWILPTTHIIALTRLAISPTTAEFWPSAAYVCILALVGIEFALRGVKERFLIET